MLKQYIRGAGRGVARGIARSVVWGAAIVTCISVAFSASFAQEDGSTLPDADRQAQVVSTRQATFKLMAHNMSAINGMARGQREFDTAIMERNARRIAELAPMIDELFAEDTRAYQVPSQALPAVWERFEEFSAKSTEMVRAANAFADTASRGDRRETLVAIRAFGAACANCHEPFRASTN